MSADTRPSADMHDEIEPLRLSRRGAETLANLLLYPPRANQKLRSLFHGDLNGTSSGAAPRGDS